MSHDTAVGNPSLSPQTSPASSTSRRSGPKTPRWAWHTLGPLAVFVVLLLLTAALQPQFLSGGGLGILAVQATPILLVALGQAAVLHVGSIDLSNAAAAILSAMVLALALGPLGYAAPLVCLAVVTAVGILNGILVAFTQVPSFALTLGSLGVLQAASLVVSKATTVYVTAHSEVVSWLFTQTFASLPIAFWFAVIIAVAGWVLLRRTSVGQGLTAVGLNETGALLSGLRTRWLKVGAFAASSFLAGLAGITVIAQAGAASSFGLGSDLLLPGIAAALVGGTAITGGQTNPVNVVFGALTVTLIPIAAAALGVTPQARSLVYGVVVVAAVALTAGRTRGAVIK